MNETIKKICRNVTFAERLLSHLLEIALDLYPQAQQGFFDTTVGKGRGRTKSRFGKVYKENKGEFLSCFLLRFFLEALSFRKYVRLVLVMVYVKNYYE